MSPSRSGVSAGHGSAWPRTAVLSGLVLWVALFPAPAPAQQFYDNVVIVLDASGSMAQSMRDNRTRKMDAAKMGIKTVMKTVPQSTRVGLLVFSASGLDEEWVFPLGPRNDAAMMQALDRVQPGASTPLGSYIKKGADRLLAERTAQFGYGTYRLLIVTDGEAQDGDLVNRYTPETMARGIVMDVIGVAMNSAHTLATKVHSYRRADDPQALNRAIREVFAEVASTGKAVALGDAFELLAPISGDVASAMIQALAAAGNEPLGTRPAPRPAPRTASTSLPNAAPPASPGQPPAAPQTPPAPSHTETRGSIFPILVAVVLGLGIFFIGIVIAVVVLIKAAKRRAVR